MISLVSQGPPSFTGLTSFTAEVHQFFLTGFNVSPSFTRFTNFTTCVPTSQDALVHLLYGDESNPARIYGEVEFIDWLQLRL